MAVANMRDDALRMQADIDELNNSTKHLLRSNDELRAALEDEPDDRDFLDAVAENELVVQKNRQQVADLERKLEALTGRPMREVASAPLPRPRADVTVVTARPAAETAASTLDDDVARAVPSAGRAGAGSTAIMGAASVPSGPSAGNDGVEGRSSGADCDGGGGGPALAGGGIFL